MLAFYLRHRKNKVFFDVSCVVVVFTVVNTEFRRPAEEQRAASALLRKAALLLRVKTEGSVKQRFLLCVITHDAR